MLANDSSAAYVEARREPAIDTEGLASCSSADDIDNGVDCAHLVEMHLFQRHTMNGSLRFTQELKRADGAGFYRLG